MSRFAPLGWDGVVGGGWWVGELDRLIKAVVGRGWFGRFSPRFVRDRPASPPFPFYVIFLYICIIIIIKIQKYISNIITL